MKTALTNYLSLPIDEMNRLWENAVFVFDTNVFLNLYRYSSSVCNSIIDSIRDLDERIWIPHHVAYEFGKNRYDVIYEMSENYEGFSKKIDKFKLELVEDFKIKRDEKEIKELEEYLHTWVAEYQSNNLNVTDPSDDVILEKLYQLFEGKVGEPYSDADLKKAKENGKDRYSKCIPPGYKDCKKEKDQNDNNAYGDYIIWSQIMDFSKDKQKDIVFVTSDKKEDWWKISHGKTVGPREELRTEFGKVSGKTFYMYTIEHYLEIYLGRVGQPGSEIRSQSILEEVKRVNRDENEKSLFDYKFKHIVSTDMAEHIAKAIDDLPHLLQEKYISSSDAQKWNLLFRSIDYNTLTKTFEEYKEKREEKINDEEEL